MAIFAAPGLQAESIGLSAIRDNLNKQYVSPISCDVELGLAIIAFIFYLIAFFHIVIMVIYKPC
jgi:hypothetical protein